MVITQWTLELVYSTGVQVVSCTLSAGSVLSDSTALFNLVLCVSQWNLFWQKISQSDCVFQLMLGKKTNCPSPLSDFNRLFKGLTGSARGRRGIQSMYFLPFLFNKCMPVHLRTGELADILSGIGLAPSSELTSWTPVLLPVTAYSIPSFESSINAAKLFQIGLGH